MLIVLEGCDGSGKSTLARRLALMLDAEIIHCTTDTPNTMWFFKEIIEMAKTKNIIADRFCYGQFVYQEPEHRNLTESNLYELELDMMNTGAKVIYVDCNTQIVEERLNGRGEIPMKPIKTLRESYGKLWKKSILPIRVLDTSSGGQGYLYQFNKTL